MFSLYLRFHFPNTGGEDPGSRDRKVSLVNGSEKKRRDRKVIKARSCRAECLQMPRENKGRSEPPER